MNIQILDSWLREHLETDATPETIAEKLSLSGPSVERIEKTGDDYFYDIEVTSNRVDMMSVRGIAREAATILVQNGVKARLRPLSLKRPVESEESLPFKVITNEKGLVNRTIGVILEDIKNNHTPDYIRKRLETGGIKSLNAIIDITNYVMLEIGHPSHAFDYDKVKTKKFIIRQSKKGEEVTTFDGKTYELPGRDIVFDNGEGTIIDLPSIMGTKNSSVDANTKRVLFFVDNNDPVRIRHTSMSLGIRTMAAIISEKGPDPELAETTILRGIDLYKSICGAKISSRIFDDYFQKKENCKVTLTKEFIENKLGIKLKKAKIENILTDLGFTVSWDNNSLDVKVPSYRANDVKIPEDIVEEVARIYGYHNIPNELMKGELPFPLPDSPFEFERNIKQIIKGLGGIEIYTLSLVPKEYLIGDLAKASLKLKNPLGEDSEYLRDNLKNSLISAAENNKGIEGPFHLFEIANTYHPRKYELPEEKMTVAGIFSNYGYREAKGVIEAFLQELNIDYKQEIPSDKKTKIEISTKKGQKLGEFGLVRDSNYIYYQFDLNKLKKSASRYSYTPLSKYPPQIEDISLVVPGDIYIGVLIQSIINSNEYIDKVRLMDVYKNTYTFRIWYQHPEKTLTDNEVEKIRESMLKALKTNMSVRVKK